jgi:hypothetical protein
MAGGSGHGWVRRANDRWIGSTQLRRVELDIGSGTTCRTMEVITLRHAQDGVGRTVTCVVSPTEFRNVNYVMTEWRGRIDPCDIKLYLPYGDSGGTLLDLPPERRTEGLLGSDFAYDDLRIWLFEESHEYTRKRVKKGRVVLEGRCVEAPSRVRHGSRPFLVTLDRTTCFVSAVDYLTSDGSQVTRSYRADDARVVDGVGIAGRMTMVDHVTGHQTAIRLQAAWHNRAIDGRIFEPDSRPDTCRYLESLT